jgi:hypothetical protein
MRKDKSLNGLSLYQRGALAELRLIGQDLYRDIKRRGVILSDGTLNPAVEAHRKNAHEQLYSLSVYAEVNRAQTSKPVDIVALMAQADAVETVDREQPATGRETAETAKAK